jgi:hypothetical protein
MKKPPYTKYTVFSITFSGPKSFDQILKKQFLEVAFTLFLLAQKNSAKFYKQSETGCVFMHPVFM